MTSPEAREALRAKAQEVVNGHREKDFACRECAMTWPCHAWLLADEILRTPAGPEERGEGLREAWQRYFNGYLFTKPTAIRPSEPSWVHRERVLFEQGWAAALAAIPAPDTGAETFTRLGTLAGDHAYLVRMLGTIAATDPDNAEDVAVAIETAKLAIATTPERFTGDSGAEERLRAALPDGWKPLIGRETGGWWATAREPQVDRGAYTIISSSKNGVLYPTMVEAIDALASALSDGSVDEEAQG